MPLSIDETIKPHEDCQCEFTPYDDYYPDPNNLSWHFRRKCLYCGYIWYGLHCPHDGFQNPCPRCKIKPTPV